MKTLKNLFTTNGYVSSRYFCDRERESSELIREITNGNNVALISTRRMGKTGLILHCFHNKKIEKEYYTFFIDIYATKSLKDFVYSMSKVILNGLKPFGKKALECFWNSVKSLQAGITFDPVGNPSFNLQLGDIRTTETTLGEIFDYLERADKPCIVAIDEFQQIMSYPEKNVEALLRTHIQHLTNARFIFAGSQRHVMGGIFTGTSRPFYQSVSMMYLESIDLQKYISFASKHFRDGGKDIEPETIRQIYRRFDGITWYIQKMLNTFYNLTPAGGCCTAEMISEALSGILDSYKYTFQEILFRLPERQKELLIAIAKEGEAHRVTSGDFVKRYSLPSSSSVQSALRGLLEKDFITQEQGIYRIYDRFFGIWLQNNI